MKIHELKREQLIPRSLGRVFPCFKRPENLGLITPLWLGFEILSPSPVAVFKGCLIDYRIRIHGLADTLGIFVGFSHYTLVSP